MTGAGLRLCRGMAVVLALVWPVLTPGPGAAQVRWGPIADATVDRVEFRVRQAVAYCGWLGGDWVTDCLADQYDQIARGLPAAAEWNPVRRVLAAAAAEMGAVARANPAPGIRPARPSEAGNPTQAAAGRALQRTRASAVPAARTLAADIETRLLRSVAGSDARAAAFRRIAVAVGTGRTLLRSG
jgi:hypothetical protein